MLNRLGHWIYHHRGKTLIIWLLLVLFLSGVGVGLGSHFTQNLSISGIPATKIQPTLEKEFNQNPNSGTLKVVIQDNQDGVTDDQTKTAIGAAITATKHRYGSVIKAVADPYQVNAVSADQTTTYVDVTFKANASQVSQATITGIRQIFTSKVQNQQTKVAYTGTVQLHPFAVGGYSEIIGIVIAFMLLLVLFRSFITAGLPILSALVGLGTGLLLVIIGTNFITLANVAETLSVMLALAVGIDYALFILNRYRMELAETKGNQAEAVGRALAAAGKSVVFAGTTVIIAVCGLAFAGIDFVTTMGWAAAVAVAVAVVSALTFLPALVAIFAKYIRPRVKTVTAMAQHPNKITKAITNHPWLIVVGTVAFLLAMASPAQQMRLGMPYNGALAKNQTERQAYDMIADKFGEGVNSPLVAVVHLDSRQGQSKNVALVMKIAQHLQGLSGTKTLSPLSIDQDQANTLRNQLTAVAQEKMARHLQATGQSPSQEEQDQVTSQIKQEVMAQAARPYQISGDGRYAMFVIIPKQGSEAVQTTDLVHQIRRYGQTIAKQDNVRLTLTGMNAVNLDITDRLNQATPLFVTTIMICAFLLLMVVFRSLLVPVVAMVGFALSLLAAFGLTTLVIQQGVFQDLFGLAKAGPILSFLPIIVTAILFGLAMDYEVFMVTRAREEYQKTGDNDRAVTVALQDSGPIVVTAALIMIAVFGSFALNSNPTIKSLALALAFGIFFDAFLIRLLFVPAMLKIFGRFNWLFPVNTKEKD